MNIEHDSERISIHDFNELEGNNLRGFLNIKRKGIISQNPFVDSFRLADHMGVADMLRYLGFNAILVEGLDAFLSCAVPDER